MVGRTLYFHYTRNHHRDFFFPLWAGEPRFPLPPLEDFFPPPPPPPLPDSKIRSLAALYSFSRCARLFSGALSATPASVCLAASSEGSRLRIITFWGTCSRIGLNSSSTSDGSDAPLSPALFCAGDASAEAVGASTATGRRESSTCGSNSSQAPKSAVSPCCSDDDMVARPATRAPLCRGSCDPH